MQDLRAAYNRDGDMAVQLDKARQQVFQLQADIVHMQGLRENGRRASDEPLANGGRQELSADRRSGVKDTASSASEPPPVTAVKDLPSPAVKDVYRGGASGTAHENSDHSEDDED